MINKDEIFMKKAIEVALQSREEGNEPLVQFWSKERRS